MEWSLQFSGTPIIHLVIYSLLEEIGTESLVFSNELTAFPPHGAMAVVKVPKNLNNMRCKTRTCYKVVLKQDNKLVVAVDRYSNGLAR